MMNDLVGIPLMKIDGTRPYGTLYIPSVLAKDLVKHFARTREGVELTFLIQDGEIESADIERNNIVSAALMKYGHLYSMLALIALETGLTLLPYEACGWEQVENVAALEEVAEKSIDGFTERETLYDVRLLYGFRNSVLLDGILHKYFFK